MNYTSDSLVGIGYLAAGILIGAVVVTSILTTVKDNGGIAYPTVVYTCFILGVFTVSLPSVIKGYKETNRK